MDKSKAIGDCRDESLVEEIFGSVSEFARQCEINSIDTGHGLKQNDFDFGPYRVEYDEDTDIHTFFWQEIE